MSLETNPPSDDTVQAAGLNEAGVQPESETIASGHVHISGDGGDGVAGAGEAIQLGPPGVEPAKFEPAKFSTLRDALADVPSHAHGKPFIEPAAAAADAAADSLPAGGAIYDVLRKIDDVDDDAPIVPHRTLVVPVVSDATGFSPSSFGLNLSPKAAKGLINLVAGLGRAGVKFHDAGGAIGWVLEQLA